MLRIACVEDQVGDDLLEMFAVAADEPHFRIDRAAERDRRGKRRHQLPEERWKPDRSIESEELRLLRIDVPQDFLGGALAAADRSGDVAEGIANRCRRIVASDHFHERLDAHEHVVEFMRERGRYLSEAAHPLRLFELARDRAVLGDVTSEADRSGHDAFDIAGLPRHFNGDHRSRLRQEVVLVDDSFMTGQRLLEVIDGGGHRLRQEQFGEGPPDPLFDSVAGAVLETAIEGNEPPVAADREEDFGDVFDQLAIALLGFFESLASPYFFGDVAGDHLHRVAVSVTQRQRGHLDLEGRAVGAAVRFADVRHALSGSEPFQPRIYAGMRRGIDERKDVAADDLLFAGRAEELDESLIHVDEGLIDVNADAIRRQLDHAAEVFTVGKRRLFGLALAGDVHHDAEQLDRYSVDAVHVDVISQPDGAAVSGDDAIDELVIPPRHSFVVAEHGHVLVLGMNVLRPEVGLVEPA
jgi:hypothetical protein